MAAALNRKFSAVASVPTAAVLEYLPWTVMCYAGAVLAWLYAFCNIAIFRTKTAESK